MNVAFRTEWPSWMGEWAGKSTYFPEKWWAGIKDQPITEHLANFLYSDKSTGRSILTLTPKRTTARENKSGRYKPGVIIQPYIWTGLPYRSKQLYFAPPVVLKKVQKLEIGNPYPTNPNVTGNIWVDGRKLNSIEMQELALNDGFESIEHFFAWFNKDWTGSLLHW